MSQLSDGGRMIIQVGSMSHQHIIKITRTRGVFNKEELLSCVFVPLIGEHGWRESEI